MASQIATKRFLDALKTVWDAIPLSSTFTGGYYDGEPPENPNAARPYLSIQNMTESKSNFTNVGEYNTLVFELHAVGDLKETVVGTLMPAALAGIEAVPMSLADGMFIVVKTQSEVRFQEELNYWRGICEYSFVIGQPR